jgi:outer membrane protein assembly factor BamB
MPSFYRICVLGLMALHVQFAAASDSWPVFRGDALSQGVSKSTLPEKPELLWEFNVPKGAFESTPVIRDGRVYIGDMDGEIYCLDLKTGQQVWKVETDSGFLASGAIQDNILVMGDYDGKVRGMNIEDGKVVWEFDAGGQIDSGANFYGPLALVASEDGCLYALKTSTGELAWKYQTGDQLRCSPSVVGNRTFLGGCDGKLHVVDLDTGLAIGEKMILGGPTGSTPTAMGDVAIVPTQSGEILGFDWKKSEPMWTFKDPELSPEIRSSPAVSDGLAIVTTRNRRMLAVDVATGKLRWEAVLRKRSDGSPVVCGGAVWVGASDGRIYAVDLKTGSEKWSTEVQGGFPGSPAVASNRLVIASDAGTVFCFGQPSQ